MAKRSNHYKQHKRWWIGNISNMVDGGCWAAAPSSNIFLPYSMVHKMVASYLRLWVLEGMDGVPDRSYFLLLLQSLAQWASSLGDEAGSAQEGKRSGLPEGYGKIDHVNYKMNLLNHYEKRVNTQTYCLG